MADGNRTRHFSGEMMTGGLAARWEQAPAADVVDADYVEVTPELPPHVRAERPAAPAAAELAQMEMLRERKAARQPTLAGRGGPAFWIAGCAAACAAFWISGGHALVRQAIPLGEAAPAAQLSVADVVSTTTTVDGAPALVVDGTVRNDGKAPGVVPALAIQVVSLGGEASVYRLGTLRTPLAPGAKYSFSSRLDVPKDGVKTVSVSFDQQD